MQTQPSDAATTAEDAFMQLMLAMGRRFRSRIDGDTVDPSQASLLYALKCHGSMRLGDLAEVMQLDASTVSRHVQQLGDRGFIEREPDPVDGRARIIALSPAGAASLKKSFDQRRAFLTAALADWDDADRERLRHDLTRLTASLGATS
ncbi:MarR family winged helix-turn-helix transcriptional regulator [Aeromicrobium ginsengisoli]|uniref:MarR family transcriptional regulator n=1 Tax=Aeromicrobium ginsengisoli TaxID=363867 RepID=A0A5M4FKS5_9ACTN|nr:MarR family transcriptional regulator [Aeromicrobium ginsengisoli]KAA1400303.1 MarR family transcriptional regulator [Aeromicrobium ginsengisoli]